MKSNPTQPIDVILHGEAMIFSCSLPKGVKKIETSNKSYHIIADSETTGNHHVVDLVEGTEFYMDEDGHMYMKTEKETQVRCVHADRHNAITIQPGTYGIDYQEEFDHLAQHMQKVRD